MQIQLLIPGLLWPVATLLGPASGLALDGLATLLGRGRRQVTAFEPYDRQLARLFGLRGDTLPMAALRRLGEADAPAPEPGSHWLCADPVNLSFAREHLLLQAFPDEELDACCGPLAVSADYIREYAVFVAEDGVTSLGFFSLIPTDRVDVIELDHFWVRPGGMGRGIGRAMFRSACDEALRRGMRTLFIVSDPNAEEFYLRMGATRTGEVPPCSGDGGLLPTLEFSLAPKETKSPSGGLNQGDYS